MRLVGEIDRRPMPWFWGINGAGGVLAASVAVLTSMAFSIDTSLQVGGVCYLLLVLPAAGLWRAVGRRDPEHDFALDRAAPAVQPGAE
jgi:hypothetical protein